jgi:hypothetical protein
MSAPVSQMSAAALPAGTEQLALIAALGERLDDARASRFGVPTVLFQHKSQVLPDEFRSRDPALASGSRKQSIGFWIQRDGRGFLPGQCHGSNMT